jgi:hypothetical protein
MYATVDAHALRNALLRLKPRRSRFRSLHEPSVEVTAGGTALVMMGTAAGYRKGSNRVDGIGYFAE